MRLTVLAENTPHEGAPVEGEHGLAILVEADRRAVLFDTGASDLVVRNADALGLGETLSRLDAVVVSHGHYDHAGGLGAVLDRVDGPVDIHVGAGFFARRLRVSAEGARDIGCPFPKATLEHRGAVFCESSRSREVLPGLLAVLDMPLEFERAAGEPGLCVESAEGSVSPDRFEDELALAVKTFGGIVVLTGCSHRGLVNAAMAAAAFASDDRVRLLAGGAHLRDADEFPIARSLRRLKELGVERLALGHCTGTRAESSAAAIFDGAFRPLRAGDCMEIA